VACHTAADGLVNVADARIDMSWQEILPNIFRWQFFSDDKGLYFNGHYVVTEDGAFVIDPPYASDEVWQEIDVRPRPQAVYLTNKDHTRKCIDFKDRYGCPIWIHQADRELVSIPIDHTYRDGDVLKGGFRVIQMPSSKSPGESALFLSSGNGVLFLGDCLIGHPPGELHLLPPTKIPDPEKAKQGLKKLLEESFDTLLVGDGESILHGGKDAISKFLQEN
jgi:hypothetical protein